VTVPGPVDRVRRSLDRLATVPLPGSGRTRDRWEVLRSTGRDDLSVARLVEGHLDALAVLSELGRADLVGAGCAWGVWAAEPSGTLATPTPTGWRLTGTKNWCSGSSGLDRALVTATAEDGPRLFAVDTGRVAVRRGSWEPIGMQDTASHTVDLNVEVSADAAVGGPSAYTDRPGFWHGGAGVAACWMGGAEGVVQALDDRVAAGMGGEAGAAVLGRLRSRLDAASSRLNEAASSIDAAPADPHVAQRTALSVRLVVEETARRVLEEVGIVLGARSLCRDLDHARRVADLTVYLRQLDVHAASTLYGRLSAERPR